MMLNGDELVMTAIKYNFYVNLLCKTLANFSYDSCQYRASYYGVALVFKKM